MDIRDKVAELYPFPEDRDVSDTVAMRSAFKAGAEWQTEQLKVDLVPEEKLNALAQYLYEGINTSPDMRLTLVMTSKATLVRVLRVAMIRADIIGGRNDWVVVTLHPDCPRCEECVDLAVDSAKSIGRDGGSWEHLEQTLDGAHALMHRAVVERKK